MARKATPAKPDASALSPARLEAARAFAVEAARLCADRRCRDVRVLQVAGLSPVTDFFVLANAASARQMTTIARELQELADQYEMPPLNAAPEPNDRWMAIDCVDAIVHLFSEDARAFYDLDNLWGDAAEIHWVRQ